MDSSRKDLWYSSMWVLDKHSYQTEMNGATVQRTRYNEVSLLFPKEGACLAALCQVDEGTSRDESVVGRDVAFAVFLARMLHFQPFRGIRIRPHGHAAQSRWNGSSAELLLTDQDERSQQYDPGPSSPMDDQVFLSDLGLEWTSLNACVSWLPPTYRYSPDGDVVCFACGATGNIMVLHELFQQKTLRSVDRYLLGCAHADNAVAFQLLMRFPPPGAMKEMIARYFHLSNTPLDKRNNSSVGAALQAMKQSCPQQEVVAYESYRAKKGDDQAKQNQDESKKDVLVDSHGEELPAANVGTECTASTLMAAFFCTVRNGTHFPAFSQAVNEKVVIDFPPEAASNLAEELDEKIPLYGQVRIPGRNQQGHRYYLTKVDVGVAMVELNTESRTWVTLACSVAGNEKVTVTLKSKDGTVKRVRYNRTELNIRALEATEEERAAMGRLDPDWPLSALACAWTNLAFFADGQEYPNGFPVAAGGFPSSRYNDGKVVVTKSDCAKMSLRIVHTWKVKQRVPCEEWAMAGVALEQGDFVQPSALVPLENIVQDNCSWDLVKRYSNVDCLLLAIELMPKDGAYWYNGFYWHLLGYRLGENAKTTGKEQDQRVQIPKSLLQNGKGCPHQEISRARSRVHSSGSSPLQPDQVDERVCYLVAHQLGERELLKSVGHDIPVALGRLLEVLDEEFKCISVEGKQFLRAKFDL